MAKNLEIHVISNTHWDREWLYNFQETRLQLVDMMDRLLDILDKHPEYAGFLLDSQTVPLEDYLELRPENRLRLVEHVTQGRLWVGPWYTAPECFCVNGESLVRNLVYGHKVAEEFGRVMKVGHTPFSYGQNSQMPQIYAGFGIDTMLFYHGVSHDEVPNEFWFEGADGTRILASQMSSFARYNFYFFVYRPVLYGTTIDQRSYSWDEGGCPFRLCAPDQALSHFTLLDPRERYDLSRVDEAAQDLREKEARVVTTKHVAFMMGHDSSVPDEREIEIIEAIRQALPQDRVYHSNLPTYVDKVRKAVKDLPVLKGERRTPKPMPLIMHLYSDVLSSRTRMKRLNALAETDLQRVTEPFSAAAWMLGMPYPHDALDMAWKTLLKCHAHDSIAGSGVDDTEQDMMYRLRQVMNLSAAVKRRSLESIQKNIDNSRAEPEDILITVFNPSPRQRSTIVTAVIDLPREKSLRAFTLRNMETGKICVTQFVSRQPAQSIFAHARDAKAMMDAERFTVHFEASKIPALGYATFKVEESPTFAVGGMVTGRHTMENDYVRISIHADGTFDLTDKSTDTTYKKLHYFEDDGEAGMAWMHLPPAHNRVISSLGMPVEIALEENGPLLTRYCIRYRMQIPAGLEENGGNPSQRRDGIGNNAKRSDETRELIITSRLTLRRTSPVLEIDTHLVNHCECHRLRVFFPTFLDAKTCHVETAFDVVERPIIFDRNSPWYGYTSVTFPMQRFVDISNGKKGLAVINDGLREYEVTQGAERAIALTLLRAYEVALTTVSKRWEPHPEMKGSQCLGEHRFRYFVYPHKGMWDQGEVLRIAEEATVSLTPAQTGAHAGTLPQQYGFMELTGDNIEICACYKSDKENTLVVRLFNPSSRREDATLAFSKPVRAAELVTLEGKSEMSLTPVGNTLKLRIPKKKIATVHVTFR